MQPFAADSDCATGWEFVNDELELDQARAERSARDADPVRRAVERALPADVTAVSTVAPPPAD
jgi:hypothetical protein